MGFSRPPGVGVLNFPPPPFSFVHFSLLALCAAFSIFLTPGCDWYSLDAPPPGHGFFFSYLNTASLLCLLFWLSARLYLGSPTLSHPLPNWRKSFLFHSRPSNGIFLFFPRVFPSGIPFPNKSSFSRRLFPPGCYQYHRYSHVEVYICVQSIS